MMSLLAKKRAQALSIRGLEAKENSYEIAKLIN
jgi:hypothetical protein